MIEKRKVVGGYLYVCDNCRAIIEAKIYEGDDGKVMKVIMENFVQATLLHGDGKCKEELCRLASNEPIK